MSPKDPQKEAEDEKDYEIDFEPLGKSILDSAIACFARLYLSGFKEGQLETFDWIEVILNVALYLLAFSCKLMILFIFNAFWVESFDDLWEPAQYDPMQQVVLNATLSYRSLRADPANPVAANALTMCSVSRSPPGLHYMVLFLWFGYAMDLIMGSLWRIFIILQLPPFYPDSDEIISNGVIAIDPPPGERKVTLTIRYLGGFNKFLAMTLCVIPDFFVNLCLLYIGAKYLAVVANVNILVKSSLKIMFVAKFDGLVHDAFVSYNWANYVKNSCYRVKKPKDLPELSNWKSTLIKAILGFGFGYFVMNFGWPQVEKFRQLCLDYYWMFPEEDLKLASSFYPEL